MELVKWNGMTAKCAISPTSKDERWCFCAARGDDVIVVVVTRAAFNQLKSPNSITCHSSGLVAKRGDERQGENGRRREGKARGWER